MKVTFYGAVREVTGSMHLLATGQDQIMLDCGMFQGRRKESEEKNRLIPIDPKTITNVVLSHAHIDHCGRIPVLTKNGFKGRIHCTRATKDASEFLLLDSAHIQESDAEYLNYKTLRSHLAQQQSSGKKGMSKSQIKSIRETLKKGPHEVDREVVMDLMQKHQIQGIKPLYTTEEATESLSYFQGLPYRETFTVGDQVSCTFYEAGHILGSALSMLTVKRNGKTYNICYSGDIGRFNKPILKDPTSQFEPEHRNVDLMLIESTYGNRIHEPVADMKNQLVKIINDTYSRGGTVLIPSFAFGRTQELIYVLHELYNEKKVPKMPIYVDSPLAINLTKVFGEHPELYDKETHKAFLEKGQNPFRFNQIQFTKSVEESMALMREETPHIVIASSGMCEAGRILHHLRYKIHNGKNTILIVGYMAQNTLGRRLLEQGTAYAKNNRQGDPPEMKFLNKTYPLKAHVISLGGFSAHADREEIIRFLKASGLSIKKIAVVHGEEDQSIAFANLLNEQGYDAMVPHVGESLEIE